MMMITAVMMLEHPSPRLPVGGISQNLALLDILCCVRFYRSYFEAKPDTQEAFWQNVNDRGYKKNLALSCPSSWLGGHMIVL